MSTQGAPTRPDDAIDWITAARRHFEAGNRFDAMNCLLNHLEQQEENKEQDPDHNWSHSEIQRLLDQRDEAVKKLKEARWKIDSLTTERDVLLSKLRNIREVIEG